MSKQLSKKKQQQGISVDQGIVDQGIHEISDEDLQLVAGGVMQSQGGKLTPGYRLDPSPNNPTAGTIYDKNGKVVGIIIGNCSSGPC